MALQGKRPLETIDLTSIDWENSHRDKRPRSSAPLSNTDVLDEDLFGDRESWSQAAAEVGSSSQELDDDELQTFQHYGTIDGKVVGIRYAQSLSIIHVRRSAVVRIKPTVSPMNTQMPLPTW